MNELTLKVIGCGDAFASGGRNHSCFFLKINRAGVLLDLGGTAFAGLKQHSVDQSQVDYIIISHLHGDHYGGLPFFLLDAGVKKRSKPLTIVGPKGLREKTLALLALLYPGTRVMEKMSIRFVSFEEPMPLSFPDFRLRAMPVIHSKATDPHGIRLETQQRLLPIPATRNGHPSCSTFPKMPICSYANVISINPTSPDTSAIGFYKNTCRI